MRGTLHSDVDLCELHCALQGSLLAPIPSILDQHTMVKFLAQDLQLDSSGAPLEPTQTDERLFECSTDVATVDASYPPGSLLSDMCRRSCEACYDDPLEILRFATPGSMVRVHITGGWSSLVRMAVETEQQNRVRVLTNKGVLNGQLHVSVDLPTPQLAVSPRELVGTTTSLMATSQSLNLTNPGSSPLLVLEVDAPDWVELTTATHSALSVPFGIPAGSSINITATMNGWSAGEGFTTRTITFYTNAGSHVVNADMCASILLHLCETEEVFPVALPPLVDPAFSDFCTVGNTEISEFSIAASIHVVAPPIDSLEWMLTPQSIEAQLVAGEVSDLEVRIYNTGSDTVSWAVDECNAVGSASSGGFVRPLQEMLATSGAVKRPMQKDAGGVWVPFGENYHCTNDHRGICGSARFQIVCESSTSVSFDFEVTGGPTSPGTFRYSINGGQMRDTVPPDGSYDPGWQWYSSETGASPAARVASHVDLTSTEHKTPHVFELFATQAGARIRGIRISDGFPQCSFVPPALQCTQCDAIPRLNFAMCEGYVSAGQSELSAFSAIAPPVVGSNLLHVSFIVDSHGTNLFRIPILVDVIPGPVSVEHTSLLLTTPVVRATLEFATAIQARDQYSNDIFEEGEQFSITVRHVPAPADETQYRTESRTYIGCYSFSPNRNTAKVHVMGLQASVLRCTAICSDHLFFGLSGADICWCANSLDGFLETPADCGFEGNICGQNTNAAADVCDGCIDSCDPGCWNGDACTNRTAVFSVPTRNPQRKPTISLMTKAASFFDAETNCNLLGGHLMSFHEDEDILALIEAGWSDTQLWIGMNDVIDYTPNSAGCNRSAFQWTDHTPNDRFLNSQWSPGEPNDFVVRALGSGIGGHCNQDGMDGTLDDEITPDEHAQRIGEDCITTYRPSVPGVFQLNDGQCWKELVYACATPGYLDEHLSETIERLEDRSFRVGFSSQSDGYAFMQALPVQGRFTMEGTYRGEVFDSTDLNVRAVECDATKLSTPEGADCMCRPGLATISLSQNNMDWEGSGAVQGIYDMRANYEDIVLDNGPCAICPPGYEPPRHPIATSDSNARCRSCKQIGPGWASPTGLACIHCTPGTQPNSGASDCEPCGAHFVSSRGIACTRCPEQFTPSNDQTSCRPCAVNEIWSDGLCIPCADGSAPYTDSMGSVCLPCPFPTAGSHGYCLRCSDSELQGPSKTECISCPEHAVRLSNQNKCICIAGYYSVNGKCEPCGIGTFRGSTDVDAVCTLCPENQVTRQLASTSVDACRCPELYYNSSAGTISCFDSLSCTPVQLAATTCVLCPHCLDCPADSDGVSVPMIRPRYGLPRELRHSGESLAALLSPSSTAAGSDHRIDIFSCPVSSMCLGDNITSTHNISLTKEIMETTTFKCRPGHLETSPLCSLCANGWIGGSTTVCVRCEAQQIFGRLGLIAIGVLFAWAFFVVLPSKVYRKVTAQRKQLKQVVEKDGFVTVGEEAILATASLRVYLKIAISHFQV